MLNNSALNKQQFQALRDSSYEIKVNIFEKKCGGCGYAHLKITEILNRASGESSVEHTFPSLEDFDSFLKEFAFAKNLEVERGCTFCVDDLKEQNNREKYWNVLEIVSNTCNLWFENKIPNFEHNIDNEFWQWYLYPKVVYKGFYPVLPNENMDEEYTEELVPAYLPTI